ncbi:energy transducer TonB [Ideonella azotifigens]|uniref:energy transducer TonB n=1 Tax=Ideonella azotifigens TaxID=513160 RepID=UPI001E56B33A|nr:energy transducer TonB [Ideonella azotifigens]MCD2340766.1 energy transducer TonB [Ideonella azotifigens]
MLATTAPPVPTAPRWRGVAVVLVLHGLVLWGWSMASRSREVVVQVDTPALVMIQVAAKSSAVPKVAVPAKPGSRPLPPVVPIRMPPAPPAAAISEALASTATPAPAPAVSAASAVPVLVAAASAASAANPAPRLTRAPQPLPGNPLPVYPEAAREDGLEGRVAMWVEVQADGLVGEVRWAQTSGTRLLDQAARDAVRRWRFAPALQAGEPVAGRLLLTLQFRLQGPVSWLAQAEASL